MRQVVRSVDQDVSGAFPGGVGYPAVPIESGMSSNTRANRVTSPPPQGGHESPPIALTTVSSRSPPTSPSATQPRRTRHRPQREQHPPRALAAHSQTAASNRLPTATATAATHRHPGRRARAPRAWVTPTGTIPQTRAAPHQHRAQRNSNRKGHRTPHTITRPGHSHDQPDTPPVLTRTTSPTGRPPPFPGGVPEPSLPAQRAPERSVCRPVHNRTECGQLAGLLQCVPGPVRGVHDGCMTQEAL